MTDVIESSTALRGLLGKHLDKIKALDPLAKERKLTGTFREKLLGQYGPRCAYCLAPREVDAAHVVPLEIGARTADGNLVLLCSHCHRLYDTGQLSINAMSKIADEWRTRKSPAEPRPQLGMPAPVKPITVPPASVREISDTVRRMVEKCQFRKAMAEINAALSNPWTKDPARTWLLIKRAEVTRRRSARGVLEISLSDLTHIRPGTVPSQCRCWFYYELTYVHRLLGMHAEAASFARRSAHTPDKGGRGGPRGLAYVSAMANETLCRLAAMERLTAEQARKFEGELAKLEAIASHQGGYWGGRWSLNCTASALQVWIKAGDGSGSWKLLEKLREMYFRWDVTTGWDAAARQLISQLEGLVRVMFPRSRDDVSSGVALLARSFMSRLGPRQRPEGIRDVGFGLVVGLRKGRADLRETANLLASLLQRTVDGTSVLWPWRSRLAEGAREATPQSTKNRVRPQFSAK